MTREAVEKAGGRSARYSLDAPHDSAETGEADGSETAGVRVKTGRTLTTLVETGGRRSADTVRFR